MMNGPLESDESALADLELAGLGLRLRPFATSDLGLIEEASADPFIPLLTTVPAVYSSTEGAAFIDRQLSRRATGEGWSPAIHEQSPC